MADVSVTEGRLVSPSSESGVSTVLVEPEDAIALMMLGHGAGTPIHEPLMVQMAAALANQKIATFRYNYPYSEDMTAYSPEKIDPLEVLLSTTNLAKSAAADLPLDLPLFLGGRSMSSQVVSLALTREHWPDVGGMAAFEPEDHAPVGADGDRPEPGMVPFNRWSRKPGTSMSSGAAEAFRRARMSRTVSRCSGWMRRPSPCSMNRLSALLLKFRIMVDRNTHHVTCQRVVRPERRA